MTDIADKHKTDAGKPAPASVAAEHPDPQSGKETGPAEKRKHTWVEKFALFFAALAFLAAGYQGWVARDTEKRQLRAYVFLDADNPAGLTRAISPTDAVEIDITMKNYGQTPAYNAVGRSWVEFADTRLPDNFGFTGPEDPNGVSKSILPAGGATKHLHTGSSRPLTADEIGTLRAGRKALYVYGRIDYDDAFGRTHYTNFCLSFRSEPGYPEAKAYCKRHNDTDDP